MPQLAPVGVEPQTSHFPGECASHYTTVTALSTLPYSDTGGTEMLQSHTRQPPLMYMCS